MRGARAQAQLLKWLRLAPDVWRPTEWCAEIAQIDTIKANSELRALERRGLIVSVHLDRKRNAWKVRVDEPVLSR
jgi:hypothetical protein